MRLALRALALVLLAAPAWGQGLVAGAPSDEETITVSSSAIGITSTLCRANAGDATSTRVNAMLQVKANGIYFSLHSASATPDAGDFEAVPGDTLILNGPSVNKLRMIRSGGADATVHVQCFQ